MQEGGQKNFKIGILAVSCLFPAEVKMCMCMAWGIPQKVLMDVHSGGMILPPAFLGNLSRTSIVTVTFLRGRSLAIIHRPPHTPGREGRREGGGPDGRWVGVRPSSIIYQTLFAPVPSACPSVRTGMCLARRPHLVNGFGHMNGRCRGRTSFTGKLRDMETMCHGEVGGGRGRNIG